MGGDVEPPCDDVVLTFENYFDANITVQNITPTNLSDVKYQVANL